MAVVEEYTHAGATIIAERRGAGHPVYVLVHGIGMGRTVFGELGSHLDAGEVIALDLPGYGEAPEPARVLTIERSADLVAAYVRERVGRPAVLVGHSMGAQVVTEVAAREPDVVDRLVLVGPTVDPSARTAARQLWRLLRDIAVESPRVILLGAREYLRAGPRIRGKFRAMLAHEPEKTFPRVTAPVLVLRGEDDFVAPRDWCASIIAALPDGRLVEVPGHGHETMIRDAAVSAREIRRFLREK